MLIPMVARLSPYL